VSTDVSEEHITSIFRVEKIISARNQLNLFLNPKDGDDMSLRNVG
jgi:hypothetical protein